MNSPSLQDPASSVRSRDVRLEEDRAARKKGGPVLEVAAFDPGVQ
jgi:hypothetical protein